VSEKSPTPDLLPHFHRQSRLDRVAATPAHEMGAVVTGAGVLARSPAGPHCHLDGPARGMGSARSEGLGAGSESLAGAAKSIANGAKAPKVNWSGLK
jgi:hypothetical protein